MLIAPKPQNEKQRLAALHRYGILDTLPDRAFDDIVSLVAQLCGTPVALISLVDTDRNWFKARVGFEYTEISRDIGFCSHAIVESDQVMIVADALEDERFRDDPLVTQAPSIRFYAGAPIVTQDGFVLGAICAIDHQPRQLNDAQIGSLRALSNLVINLLEHARLLREKAKQAIDTGRHQMENLLALSMDGLDLQAFIGPDYTYKYLNRTYLDYWNKRPEQAVGKSVAEVMGEEAFAKVQPMMARALEGASVSSFARVDYPTKGARHMQVSYMPARDVGGTVIGLVFRANDVQELKDSEDKLSATVALLEEKNRSQQHFIHILSHDLSEPVNTIVNFASLLTTDHAAALPDEAQQYLRFIANGGERMKELLDDLLVYVRIDDDRLVLRPIEFNRLMARVCEDLGDAISRKQAKVEWAALPVIVGERSLIRILMQNLVVNAIKFSRPDVAPVVLISAVDHGDSWELRVQDNGIGIPEAKREKIFGLFQRLHSRQKFSGTGLGLTTCRKIVELHNGRIWASAAPEHGSRFHVMLPKIIPQANGL